MSIEIFVSVGTDHHPFGRLIGWIDRWAAKHPDVALIVQHGSSPPSTIGENHAMMTGEELGDRYRAADVVVAQVGPGTISDANKAGLVPFVVPRDPALGEVVDDHQYAFGEFMATRGRCIVITTESALCDALDDIITNSAAPRFDIETRGLGATNAIATLVADLVNAPRRRLSWRRLADMLRRPPTIVKDSGTD